ncbi:MAG TPA: APC family permease [Trebonia sp.]|nr:APC family permease [Trebonia sp.]
MTETLSRTLSPAAHPVRSPSSPGPAVSPGPAGLTTARGTALYIGALLGPGLLLLPGLAAAEAGPASVLAWAGLLILSGLFAVVFGSLGRRFPSAGGVIGYVRAGLGQRASAIAGWSFLAGVVAGAPVVCLIGAGYVTELTGGGRLGRALIAALLLLAVMALAAGGLRASATAQLLLVSMLLAVVVVAVVGSAGSARAANWTPFAPHGWQAVGHAASTLMLSFVGWEAVAPLTTRFSDPSRQLPGVIGSALVVTSVLYLGLAIATIGVLGTGAGISAPLAALLRDAAGPAGTVAAAVAAVVLTLGAVNAYVTGATEMAVELARQGDARPAAGAAMRPAPRFLAAIAASSFALISLYGLGLVSPAALVAIPTTLFLVVYLGCMASAARVLRGPARLAAAPAAVIVAVVLAFCGLALLAALALVLAVCSARPIALAAAQIRKRYESR